MIAKTKMPKKAAVNKCLSKNKKKNEKKKKKKKIYPQKTTNCEKCGKSVREGLMHLHLGGRQCKAP